MTTEDGEQPRMEEDRQEPRSNRLAPLVQVALAVLVAGSLLAFSALAFRTGFSTSTNNGITADAPDSHAGSGVVLPDGSPSVAQTEPPPPSVTVAATQPEPSAVLSKRVTEKPGRKPTDKGIDNNKPGPSHGSDPSTGKGKDGKDGKDGDKHLSSDNKDHSAREEDEGWADRDPHDDSGHDDQANDHHSNKNGSAKGPKQEKQDKKSHGSNHDKSKHKKQHDKSGHGSNHDR